MRSRMPLLPFFQVGDEVSFYRHGLATPVKCHGVIRSMRGLTLIVQCRNVYVTVPCDDVVEVTRLSMMDRCYTRPTHEQERVKNNGKTP